MTEDIQLVERARAGSREAFNELVYRHRAKAYGWAQQVMHDSYLAEDVVQEALFKAFLHMEKLMDSGRFIPWLQRIVRNQALMELRKGSQKREISIGDCEAATVDVMDNGVEQTVHVLSRALARKTENRSGGTDWVSRIASNGNPEGLLLGKETEANIRGMLACLMPKERSVFEAYFFQQLSPKEIADSLHMKRNHVYVTLHRSKQKLQEEQLRGRLALYMSGRRAEGRSVRADLGCLPVRWEENYFTFWGAVHGALQATNKHYLTMADVMGFTGHAFRIGVLPDIGPASAMMYDFTRINGEGMRLLGFDARIVNGFGRNYVTPDMLTEAFRLIHESIDRGVPVIGWNLDNYEFGLIYGYDDQEQVLFTCDISTNKGKKLKYEELGRRSANGSTLSPELFVMSIADRHDQLPVADRMRNSNRVNLDEKRMFRQSFPHTLRLIVDHATGFEQTPVDGVAYGLKAIDAWIEAFKQGTIDPFGNGYNLLLLTDARKFAVHFLAKSSVIDFERIYNYRFQRLLSRALLHYTTSFDSWVALREMFPFPNGGNPHDPATAAKAIQLLRTIRDAENQGIALFRGIHETMTDDPAAFTELTGPPF